jgi:hypothetical protein
MIRWTGPTGIEYKAKLVQGEAVPEVYMKWKKSDPWGEPVDGWYRGDAIESLLMYLLVGGPIK